MGVIAVMLISELSRQKIKGNGAVLRCTSSMHMPSCPLAFTFVMGAIAVFGSLCKNMQFALQLLTRLPVVRW